MVWVAVVGASVGCGVGKRVQVGALSEDRDACVLVNGIALWWASVRVRWRSIADVAAIVGAAVAGVGVDGATVVGVAVIGMSVDGTTIVGVAVEVTADGAAVVGAAVAGTSVDGLTLALLLLELALMELPQSGLPSLA